MKFLNRLLPGLSGLGLILAAGNASAQLTSAIAVPWEGDVTKYHTAIGGQGPQSIASLGAPTSVTFQTLSTSCYSGGEFTFKINGTVVGTQTPPANCSCSPGFQQTVVSGAALSAAWSVNAANPVIEVVFAESGDVYVASASYTVAWTSTSFTSLPYSAPGNGGVNDTDLCDGDVNDTSFDVSQTLTLINGQPGTISTSSILLKGVLKTTGSSATSVTYQWDPGDGSGYGSPTTVSVPPGIPYPVSMPYSYSGAVGTPYIAHLKATDGTTTLTSPYNVQMQAAGLQANINIAIDNGLWYLYSQGNFVPAGSTATSFNTFDQTECVYWSSANSIRSADDGTFYASPTGSAVQTFEINGSLATGNFNQDPYAEFVAGGLNFLFKGYVYNTSYPILQAVNISPRSADPSDNPDSNGNGIGITVADTETFDSYDYCVYQGGMVMDAIVASGTPNASTGRIFVGSTVATYGQVLQDMCDMYAWGQDTADFPIGGWHYYWTYPDQGDNSASQWGAIGLIAAQQAPFNSIVPSWVKTYDNNYLNYSFYTSDGGAWGHFGYNGPGSTVGPGTMADAAETPSGLVQMILDGFTTSDTRWQEVETYLAQNWDTGANYIGTISNNTIYPAYSFAKAMRLAQPSPIVDLSPTGYDWYNGSTSDPNGMANTISSILLNNNGHTANNYWEGTTLGTAWAVIILKPNLFSAGPTACFTANPNPNFANEPTYFDPSCSSDPQPGGISNIVQYVWNWGDGTPNTTSTTPAIVTHDFACTSLPCSYVVTLTVTDNSTPPLTSTYQQTINITEPPHPPVADAGGPYIVSLCTGDTLTLNGSGSYTPDQGLSQTGCNTCPPNHLTAYGWALTGAPYTYTASTETNPALGTAFTTYFPTAGQYPIGLQVTDDAAQSFPGGASSDLTDASFSSVTVYSAGPCDVTITGGCSSVTLNWNSTGASSYQVLASTTSPNSGFTVVGSTTGTTTSVSATLGQTVWYRVQGLDASGNVISMSGATEFVNTFSACTCISTVTVQTKNVEVALSWAGVQGASCYNVYRATAPGVQLTSANLIASCIGNPNDDYTDLKVVNGKTYYYVVSVVVNGVETCRSEEVHGTPSAPVR